ncbi:MAG: hypothetical protein H0X39_19180, partial [Actinobacteria bacterium]|nr:hypothetical protein [Actinomycetota bacterium]
YGLYGLLAAVVCWFDPSRALPAGLALGLIRATITSTSWGGGPAYRDAIPLAIGLGMLALRTRKTGEAVE